MNEYPGKSTLTEESEFQEWRDKIDDMTQIGCAKLHRFAPSGHPVFAMQNEGLHDYFRAHWTKLGGMTPAISKAIGWD